MYLQKFLGPVLLIFTSILWCELGYYYFIFKFSCKGWPALANDHLKLMLVADTHIMGPIKSVYIDKIRREWQMKRAFSLAVHIYQPDVIVFMGDLFDEASFSSDRHFQDALDDFNAIFSIDSNMESIILPGNHDVGFHNQMIDFPYLTQRFNERFPASPTSVAFARPKVANDLNILVANSMSFYNDTCPRCTKSIADVNIIVSELPSRKPARPILLHHIPLHRLNDTGCDYPDSLAEKVAKSNIEGEDVIHQVSSNFILDRLKPRLVISGHTHMLCNTTHYIGDQPFQELTISSFNHKYAEKRPGFLLLSVNQEEYLAQHCYLVEEWVIVTVYLATLLVIIARYAAPRSPEHGVLTNSTYKIAL